MRFVLVAISVCIASFAWWRCSSSTEADASHDTQADFKQQQQQQQRRGQLSAKQAWPSRARSWLVTLLDMLSGRYIYNAIAQGAAKQSRCS